jgi:hypothetical protein
LKPKVKAQKLDIHGISEKQNIFHNYDGVSAQFVHYGSADVYCTAMVPTVEKICGW